MRRTGIILAIVAGVVFVAGWVIGCTMHLHYHAPARQQPSADDRVEVDAAADATVRNAIMEAFGNVSIETDHQE